MLALPQTATNSSEAPPVLLSTLSSFAKRNIFKKYVRAVRISEASCGIAEHVRRQRQQTSSWKALQPNPLLAHPLVEHLSRHLRGRQPLGVRQLQPSVLPTLCRGDNVETKIPASNTMLKDTSYIRDELLPCSSQAEKLRITPAKAFTAADMFHGSPSFERAASSSQSASAQHNSWRTEHCFQQNTTLISLRFCCRPPLCRSHQSNLGLTDGWSRRSTPA